MLIFGGVLSGMILQVPLNNPQRPDVINFAHATRTAPLAVKPHGSGRPWFLGMCRTRYGPQNPMGKMPGFFSPKNMG